MMYKEFFEDKGILVVKPLANEMVRGHDFDFLADLPVFYRIGFDFENIKNFSNELIEFLKELSSKNEIAIFNLSTENLAVLNLMGYSFFISVFMSKKDFMENKYVLKRPKLKVLK